MVYYLISGSTDTELRQQLNVLGPVGYDGVKWDATTRWDIKWDWPGRGSSTCDLNTATASYNIQVIFPLWKPSSKVASGLVAEWLTYVRALATHEKGHVDLVLAHFPAVVDAIKRATCDTAEAAAQEAATRIHQLSNDYDTTTNHGATQGVQFPP